MLDSGVPNDPPEDNYKPAPSESPPPDKRLDPQHDPMEALGAPPAPLDSTRILLHHIHLHNRWAGRAEEILFRRYRPLLEAWVRSRHSGGGALLGGSDIVQETMKRALRGLGSFEHRGQGSFLAWLRTIASRVVADGGRIRRRKVPEVPISEDHPDRAQSPVEALIGSEQLERFEAAVQELPDKQREAVLLWAEFGMKLAEIAEEMGISPSAARMNLQRGLRTLAAKLGVDLDRRS